MALSPIMDGKSYHQWVPAKDHPKIQGLDHTDPYEYSREILKVPMLDQVAGPWRANLKQPFYGVTSNGHKAGGLYLLKDEGAPTHQMVCAATRVLDSLSDEQRSRASLELDGEQWRRWCNPEFILYDVGVRLESLAETQKSLIMDLLRSSLSEAGFAKARGAMKTNKFLGHICSSRSVLNEYSYFFSIYGQPSEHEPWGYALFGHHLSLNVFVVGNQMTIGPCFIGAEPNVIDEGPDSGQEILTQEADLGLELMQSLPANIQKKAQIYRNMKDPAMPAGRWHPADERHLAGAFQDNRIIPYEGITAVEMAEAQQSILLRLISAFLELLPPGPFEARIEQIIQHLPITYFSWIGGYGPDDPFYYRIQSPVVLLEFDHHSGVFLTNMEPAKYHVHTIQRMPNGNDYARELIKLHRLKAANAE